METYAFIRLSYRESGYETIYAIDPDKIKSMNLSYTYNNYGQLIDTADAGDWITLDSEKAVGLANRIYNEENEESEEFEEKFSLNDSVSDYDHSDVFSQVRETLKEGEDYTHYSEEVKGFNYWDGSNWRSVIVEAEHHDPEWEVITDQDMIAELSAAIEEREFVKEGFGEKIYHGGAYQVVYNYCQWAFASWELDRLEDLEEYYL